MMRDRYGVKDPKAQHFRFGVVCGGSSLVAPQPYNNIVRVAVETMAAVFGGAQSIFTCAFDEAFQIPTEASAEIAVRTQQIIAFESGIARSVDPLAGSYVLEQHTNRMQEEIEKIMSEIDAYGGVVPAIEDGWLQSRLAHRALERKQRNDSGETVVVGQNHFRNEGDEGDVKDIFTLSPTVAARALEKYERVLQTRNQAAVAASLARLTAAAQNDRENVMPYLVDCCHAYATVGEMVAKLREVWGEFKEPVNL
jgi:methylmalonyl-CoA mutase N-terminal domain/subunit